MEAQRYPDDFDGIIAGAPAADFTGIGAQFIKDIKALYPDPKQPLGAAVHAGDAEERREPDRREVRCRRRRQRWAPRGSAALHDRRDALTGLTDAQKSVLKTIYGETRNKDGVIFPAQPVGSRRRSECVGRMDYRSQLAGDDAPEGAEPALRVRHARCSSTSSSTIRPGTTASTTSANFKKDCGAGVIDSERDQSESRRVQGQQRQADHLARLVGSGADRARHDQVRGRGARARRRVARLRAHVPDARRAALRRRARTGSRRLDQRRSRTGWRKALRPSA